MMKHIDVAIKLCDSYPKEFPTENEKWEYEKEFGKKKERKPITIFVYKADIYYNYGKEQKYIETKEFDSIYSDNEKARKDYQRSIGNQKSVKHLKFLRKYTI